MTQLDKLKQAAENSLKEKFSCVVYPYLGSGMLTNTEDADVIERNTNYCLTASLEFATSEAAREYWSSDAIEFSEWINNEGFIRDPFPRDKFDDDILRYHNFDDFETALTIEELHQEFLKQKEK